MKSEYRGYSYVYLNEEGKVIAEVDFPLTERNIITITHTYVDDCLRGQGIAKELVKAVLSFATENKLSIKATCSYAKSYFEKNPNPIYLKTE